MIDVHVKLIGAVHDVARETGVDLTMPEGATVGDFLPALVERLGKAFGERVLRSDGGMQSYARLFVDGVEVDNDHLDRPIAGDGQSKAEVKLFVVFQYMGGQLQKNGDPTDETS